MKDKKQLSTNFFQSYQKATKVNYCDFYVEKQVLFYFLLSCWNVDNCMALANA